MRISASVGRGTMGMGSVESPVGNGNLNETRSGYGVDGGSKDTLAVIGKGLVKDPARKDPSLNGRSHPLGTDATACQLLVVGTDNNLKRKKSIPVPLEVGT
eukprot:c13480_g1_i1 orf=2-301(-)